MRILTRCVCCICMCTYLCMCVYIYPCIWHIWLIVQWLCFCCCSSCAAHTKFIDCRIHTCRMLQPLWCVVVKMARISCVSQRKWPQCTHTHTHARSSCSNSSSRHRVLVYLNFRSSWPALSLSLSLSHSLALSLAMYFWVASELQQLPAVRIRNFWIDTTQRMRNLPKYEPMGQITSGQRYWH